MHLQTRSLQARGRRSVGAHGRCSGIEAGRKARRSLWLRRALLAAARGSAGRGQRGALPARGAMDMARGSVQATRRRRAGCLARAGRSCITPACDAKASASSGPHTSSAPSAVKVRLIACIESVQTLSHEHGPHYGSSREAAGEGKGPVESPMRAVFGVLVALAASATPSLAFAFSPANGAAGSYAGIFAHDAARRSFAAGFAADRPAWPLQPAAARHVVSSSPRAGVLDMLMQERGRGRGARGGSDRGGRGGGAGRAQSPADRGDGYGMDDTNVRGRGGRGGGAGRARLSPAGRGGGYGWDDPEGRGRGGRGAGRGRSPAGRGVASKGGADWGARFDAMLMQRKLDIGDMDVETLENKVYNRVMKKKYMDEEVDDDVPLDDARAEKTERERVRKVMPAAGREVFGVFFRK